jgi:hypothetical protein
MAVILSLGLFVTPSTALYTQPVPNIDIRVSEDTSQGRTQAVLDFNQGEGIYARDLGTIFSWSTANRIVLDVWQPSLIEQPETIYNRASDWNDGGYQGDKFIQGYQIEANSFNAAKSASLQSSDDLSSHTLLEMPATFNLQSVKTFSCVPFISHSVRLTSFDSIPWEVFNEKLIFEPYPSSCLEWSTELMSYGNGWQHIRMLNIPYIASAAVTMTMFFDQWPTIVIANQLPATASQLYPTKQKVNVPANKSKLMGFTLSSTAPFRVFKQMLEVWVGPWGRTGPYETVKPFGGDASDGAKA